MNRRAAALAFALAAAAALPVHAAVKAWLDSSQIAEGDTVQLTLEHQGRTSGQPELAPLERNFDILETSTGTSVRIVNGSFSESVDVVLTLAPKRTGRLTVPAISWDGEHSEPLALTVSGPDTGSPAGTAAAHAARVFIETHIEPTHPYVQAAVDLTVRLFTSKTLYRADLELTGNTHMLVKRIGTDRESNVERDGRSYRVITRHYLLFPLRSGRVTLAGPVLDAEIAGGRSSVFATSPLRGFFSGSFGGLLQTARPIRVRGRTITLAVRPRPAAALGGYWLPASKITLSAHWSPSALATAAGNPLTLDLDLQASGLTAAQLPDLSRLLEVPAGLKAYPDQAKLLNVWQNGTLVGSRDQSIAFIADRSGHYTIPRLSVRWWDTRTHRLREATLPAQSLHVLPPPASSAAASTRAAARARVAPAARARPTAPAAAAVAARGRSSWKWISTGLAALWLATLGGWLASRRKRRPPRRSLTPPAPDFKARPDPAGEKAAFRAAARNNDALAARRHLLAWAAATWGSAPSGLTVIAARTADARTSALLRDLDRACYAGREWHGEPLAEALRQLPSASGKKADGRENIAPLYP